MAGRLGEQVQNLPRIPVGLVSIAHQPLDKLGGLWLLFLHELNHVRPPREYKIRAQMHAEQNKRDHENDRSKTSGGQSHRNDSAERIPARQSTTSHVDVREKAHDRHKQR